MIKLSVIIITYNHEKFIEQCIKSVLMQQCSFDFELLIGDDASTDNTTAICKKYAEQYPEKINVNLRQKKDKFYINGTPVGRKNFSELLKSAKGEYVARIDGDDYWEDPLKLQKQVDFLENNPTFVVCYHGCKLVDENNEIIKASKSNIYSDFTQEQLLQCEGQLITNTVMFRNLIPGIPDFFDETPSGDSILWHLLGFHGAAKFMSNIDFSAYRVHSGGIWSNINELKRLKNSITTLKSIRLNTINHFGKQSVYIKGINQSIIENFTNYFYQQLYYKRFNSYLKGIAFLLKSKGINRSIILKEHFVDLFKRALNKK